MNKHHKKILNLIRLSAGKSKGTKQNEDYVGTKSTYYNLRSAEIKQIAQVFKEENKNLSHQEFVGLISSLNTALSFEEKIIYGSLIRVYPKHRKQLDPKLYDKWLENLHGWAEIDCCCQSAFSAKEMESKWSEWRKVLIKFSKSKSVSKQRASLVLLTRPVRETSEEKFTKLALENIDTLKYEKDILVTKAISWLLREMTKLHKLIVIRYLKENMDSLPKIAIRETTRKLETGRK